MLLLQALSTSTTTWKHCFCFQLSINIATLHLANAVAVFGLKKLLCVWGWMIPPSFQLINLSKYSTSPRCIQMKSFVLFSHSIIRQGFVWSSGEAVGVPQDAAGYHNTPLHGGKIWLHHWGSIYSTALPLISTLKPFAGCEPERSATTATQYTWNNLTPPRDGWS